MMALFIERLRYLEATRERLPFGSGNTDTNFHRQKCRFKAVAEKYNAEKPLSQFSAKTLAKCKFGTKYSGESPNSQIPLQKPPFSKNFQESSKFFQNSDLILTLNVDNVVRCCQHDEVIH
jgi:hypothetical protein